jgi:multisubunit Na+/H+ antiporter MnhC subunit
VVSRQRALGDFLEVKPQAQKKDTLDLTAISVRFAATPLTKTMLVNASKTLRVVQNSFAFAMRTPTVTRVPGNASHRVVSLESQSALRRAPTSFLEFKPQAQITTSLALTAISVSFAATHLPKTMLVNASKTLRVVQNSFAFAMRTPLVTHVPGNAPHRVVSLETQSAFHRNE